MQNLLEPIQNIEYVQHDAWSLGQLVSQRKWENCMFHACKQALDWTGAITKSVNSVYITYLPFDCQQGSWKQQFMTVDSRGTHQKNKLQQLWWINAESGWGHGWQWLWCSQEWLGAAAEQGLECKMSIVPFVWWWCTCRRKSNHPVMRQLTTKYYLFEERIASFHHKNSHGTWCGLGVCGVAPRSHMTIHRSSDSATPSTKPV